MSLRGYKHRTPSTEEIFSKQKSSADRARIEMKPEEKRLADYMSELSELAYCAGWMKGLEYVLWSAIVDGRPREYGRLRIHNKHTARLKELSDACDGWIVFDDDKGETFVPLADWLRVYAARQGGLTD